MNRPGSQGATALLLASILLFGFLLAGCATTPRVDWNSRIATYTYDQAVLEMGPPDRMASLEDGTRVGEWLTSRGYSHGYVTAFGPHFYHPYAYGPPAYYYSDAPAPDRLIRLTFGPDGKLAAWKKIYR
jgi:hypothetical protein